MVYSFSFLAFGFLLYQASTLAVKLNCNVHSFEARTSDEKTVFDGTVELLYERDNLAIYAYNKTKYVNFLLYDVKINFDGIISDGELQNSNLVGQISADVEGIATMETRLSPLTQCELDLQRALKYSDDVSRTIQDNMVTVAETCIRKELCSELGNAVEDDYIRADIEEYDFKENSVAPRMMNDKYPNLHLPDRKDTSTQSTLNLFIDFWLASAVNLLSGKDNGIIQLPNIDEKLDGFSVINGYFQLLNGTFGNLKGISRTLDINITHAGLEFSAEVEFELPHAEIHYDQLNLKYATLVEKGAIDVKIENIKFNLKIIANYNIIPCKIAVSNMQASVDNISFNLKGNSFMDNLINKVVNDLLEKHTKNLIDLVKAQLRKAISAPLAGFDCEQFRP